MPSTRLSDTEAALQLAYACLLADFRDQTGHDLLLTCTERTVEEQAALYAKGRTAPGGIVTQLDGTIRKSKHNAHPARAVDVAVVINGKVSWDPAQYAPLGPLAERYGLIWGGTWDTFKDYPHLELPD